MLAAPTRGTRRQAKNSGPVWGEHAEAAFAETVHGQNTDVAEVIRALRSVLGDNDMMASQDSEELD